MTYAPFLALSAALLSLPLAATAQTAATTAPAALEIYIGGIGPGVDAVAFRKVKLVLSQAVYSSTIDYFHVDGYGKEGGFSACVEQGRFAATGSFESLIKSLKAIHPNANTTAYNLTPVAHCTYPLAP
jgi:hypothetical protein